MQFADLKRIIGLDRLRPTVQTVPKTSSTSQQPSRTSAKLRPMPA